jgi:hypothetical protein
MSPEEAPAQPGEPSTTPTPNPTRRPPTVWRTKPPGYVPGVPEPPTDPTRCGAKLRYSDPPRYCTQPRVRNRKRCRIHGGKSPVALANPAFRNGTKSFYMPQRLAEGYAQELADPDLLSLRREIAAHRAAASDLRRRLDEGEGGGAGLQTAWRDFRAAHRAGSPERLAETLTRLDAAITRQGAEEALRRELRQETELVSRLTRAENDRMEQLHQMVSREQALAYMRGLAVAVKEAVDGHVGDPSVRTSVLRAISARFEQLNDRRGRPDAGAGGPDHDAVDPAADL